MIKLQYEKVFIAIFCAVCLAFSPMRVSAYSPADSRAIPFAQKIYSVMHYLGLPDINIAGILANYQSESFLDSTSVEAVFDELFTIGGKKQQFNQNMTSFFQGYVVDAWAKQGVTLRTEVYKGSDGQYYPGIGLGAWTGENCRKLVAKANEVGMDWWDFDYQLAYIISDQYRPGVVRGWTEPAVSVEDSAYWYMENWEGYRREWSQFTGARLYYAPIFYDMITNENWSAQVDTEYAKKVISLADTLDGKHTLEELELVKMARHVCECTSKVLVQFLDIIK